MVKKNEKPNPPKQPTSLSINLSEHRKGILHFHNIMYAEYFICQPRNVSHFPSHTRCCYPAGMIRECELIAMLLYDGFFSMENNSSSVERIWNLTRKRMRKSFDCVSIHSDSLGTFPGDNFSSSNSLNSFTACLICDDFFLFSNNFFLLSSLNLAISLLSYHQQPSYAPSRADNTRAKSSSVKLRLI